MIEAHHIATLAMPWLSAHAGNVALGISVFLGIAIPTTQPCFRRKQ